MGECRENERLILGRGVPVGDSEKEGEMEDEGLMRSVKQKATDEYDGKQSWRNSTLLRWGRSLRLSADASVHQWDGDMSRPHWALSTPPAALRLWQQSPESGRPFIIVGRAQEAGRGLITPQVYTGETIQIPRPDHSASLHG